MRLIDYPGIGGKKLLGKVLKKTRKYNVEILKTKEEIVVDREDIQKLPLWAIPFELRLKS